MEEGNKIIETLDENGNVVKFELYDIVDYEDREYALLMPVDSKEDDEIVLMRLINENEEYLFEAIEDEEEFNAVSEYIGTLEE